MSALAVATQAPALRVNGIGKAYTNHAAVAAIGAIDLEVSPGELIAVLGPRGCGTSTLLAMIARLEPATLADRVVLLSPRPARVVAELAVDVAHPRLAEDPVLHAMARDLTAGLRAAA